MTDNRLSTLACNICIVGQGSVAFFWKHFLISVKVTLLSLAFSQECLYWGDVDDSRELTDCVTTLTKQFWLSLLDVLVSAKFSQFVAENLTKLVPCKWVYVQFALHYWTLTRDEVDSTCISYLGCMFYVSYAFFGWTNLQPSSLFLIFQIFLRHSTCTILVFMQGFLPKFFVRDRLSWTCWAIANILAWLPLPTMFSVDVLDESIVSWNSRTFCR